MRTNTIEFLRNLRAIANELQPFSDPSALAWWTRLDCIAGLLETEETEIGAKQLSYLGRTLFGSGGFIDFALDEEHSGLAAKTANRRIDAKRVLLFQALNRLRFRWEEPSYLDEAS